MIKFTFVGLLAIVATVQGFPPHQTTLHIVLDARLDHQVIFFGIDMPLCAQTAMRQGVPSLGIPSHDPLIIPGNFSFKLDNFFDSTLEFGIDNVEWINLANWNVIKDSVTKNTTDVLDINAGLWWDTFQISFDFDYSWGLQKFGGHIDLVYEDIYWDAHWEETKPDNTTGVRVLNFLKIHQKIGHRIIASSGFGDLGFIANHILLAVNDFVLEFYVNQRNLFGSTFQGKINDVWYGKPAVLKKLVDWCVSQNITSEYE